MYIHVHTHVYLRMFIYVLWKNLRIWLSETKIKNSLYYNYIFFNIYNYASTRKATYVRTYNQEGIILLRKRVPLPQLRTQSLRDAWVDITARPPQSRRGAHLFHNISLKSQPISIIFDLLESLSVPASFHTSFIFLASFSYKTNAFIVFLNLDLRAKKKIASFSCAYFFNCTKIRVGSFLKIPT